jgi:CheY-like chemotaxis protein
MQLDLGIPLSASSLSSPLHLFWRRPKPEIAQLKTRDQKFPSRREHPLVLVVDDEPIIAETLTIILSEQGFEVVTANNGLTAVDEASRLKPDIVLLDVAMPRLNGVEAAKRILSAMPEVRILLFSGQAETADLLADAREDGFEFEVLAKPVKPEVLLRSLRPSGKSS